MRKSRALVEATIFVLTPVHQTPNRVRRPFCNASLAFATFFKNEIEMKSFLRILQSRCSSCRCDVLTLFPRFANRPNSLERAVRTSPKSRCLRSNPLKIGRFAVDALATSALLAPDVGESWEPTRNRRRFRRRNRRATPCRTFKEERLLDNDDASHFLRRNAYWTTTTPRRVFLRRDARRPRACCYNWLPPCLTAANMVQ